MQITFTITQKERLTELSTNEDMMFNNAAERDSAFRILELKAVKENKAKLQSLLNEKHVPDTLDIQKNLGQWLIDGEGFTQVSTPLIITRQMLDKMTITKETPLSKQVFWIDEKKCLRPMLAPNLYTEMRELRRITNGPIKIFEVGSCFRKESQGALHLNEFTMLNFVELASVEVGQQMDRLEYMAREAMKCAGIEHYKLEKEKSTVYGETLDIVVDGIEVASGSFGPHFLDAKWGVFDPWVGIGFGIERLALVKNGYKTIKRVSKSLSYLDGVPFSI